jgi:hypothetical protein
MRKKNAYKALLGKPEGNRPLGRSRRRWEDNIKVNFREYYGVELTRFIWLWIGTVGGLS